MVELDHNQKPTTSQFPQNVSPNIFGSEDEIVRLKRLRRFKRQLSIYVQTEDIEKNEGKEEDGQVFKYPGSLRGIKRKRVIVKKPIKEKRKMLLHQKSIQQQDPADDSCEVKKEKNSIPEAEEKSVIVANNGKIEN